MLDFFFGPDRRPDMEYVRIGPRSYDIDVVEGVISIMRQELEAQDNERRRVYGSNPDKPLLKDEDLPSRRYPMTIEVRPPELPGTAASTSRQVLLQDVPGLSRAERARLVVHGAQARVEFVERGFPDVWSIEQPLRSALEHYLRTEGRRRVHWTRVAAGFPAAAGVALIPLWVVASLAEHFDIATAIFGYILAAGGLAAGIVASRKLSERASNQVKGHRFRESTRADFRAAVTSVRAGVLTSAGGTILGVVLTVIFYKLTGIDPA